MDEFFATIDVKLIDELLGVLTGLKNEGGVVSPATWQSKGSTSPSYGRWKFSLNKLTELAKALQVLVRSTQGQLELQAETIGNSSSSTGSVVILPNEILATIFEYACPVEKTDVRGLVQATVSISHVNRRFRTLALCIPNLWAVLSNWQHPSLCLELLQRSRRASGLLIDIRKSHRDTKPKDFFQIITSPDVTSRWQTFNLEPRAEAMLTLECSEKLRTLELPKLERLRIVSMTPIDFISTWKFPRLKSFDGSFVHFPPHIKVYTTISATSQITSCALSVQDLRERTPVLRFLGSLESLESLSLEICSCFNAGGSDLPKDFFLLKNVRNLRLTISESIDRATMMRDDPRQSAKLLGGFLGSVDAPKIDDYSVTFKGVLERYVPGIFDPDEWLKSALSLQNLPNLPITKLKISFEIIHRGIREVRVASFLDKFPRLQELDLDPGHSKICFLFKAPRGQTHTGVATWPPAIKRVRFKSWSEIQSHGQGIGSFIKLLQDKQSEDRPFERLEITQYQEPTQNRDFFNSKYRVPEEKIVWKAFS